jgi:GTP-binding protein
LAAVSAARPKVGDYPFTTIEPQLGVVDVGWEQFVVADIPGLIEGAHEGAGLGLDFLRHIERTRLIIHLVDGSSADAVRDFDTVRAELQQYGHGLADRPSVVVINKLDIPDVADRKQEIEAAFQRSGLDVTFISAASGEGVKELMAAVATKLAELPGPIAQTTDEGDLPILRPMEGRVRAVKQDGHYEVIGAKPVSFAETMPLESEEGVAEVWRRFQRWGVTGALKRAGAQPGDRVRLGNVELEMR